MSTPASIDQLALEEVRVLIVDDHDLFRSGLRNLLEEEGVQIGGEPEVYEIHGLEKRGQD